jgi:peroxiredoxin Q/BCP
MVRLSCLAASFVVLSAWCITGARAVDADKPIVLNIGDKAPEFSARTDQGKLWKSADHVGKKILVVYFYPADMTGGCTAQACSYRDALDQIKNDDVEVIGVSGDTVDSHQKFKQEYDLNFTLLADADGKVAKSFGVKTAPGFKNTAKFKTGETLDLARKVTAMRWTFIVDRDGKIIDKNEQVDAAKDADRVIKKIEALSGKEG